MTVKKFWIRFERIPKPTFLNWGCGVTAYDQEDAVELLEQGFQSMRMEMPKIAQILEGVEVEDLEQNHVVPNIGDMNVRGVWFPNLSLPRDSP
jgi:hypothetical protein